MENPAISNSLVPISSRSGFSFRDFVFIFYRRRWIALAVSLPIMFMGALSLYRQTGSYTAGSRVLVELQKVDLPQWDISGRNIDYDRELSTLFNLAMSLSVAENAAAALRDSIPLILSHDPRIVGTEDPNWLRDYLLGGLDVSPVGQSNILEFRFSSPDPRISLMAVGAMQDAFMDYYINGRRNTSAVIYYEEQVSLVRAQVDSLLQVRAQVMHDYGFTSLKDDLNYEVGLQANLQGKLNEATTVRRSLEIQYLRLQAYLEDDPRVFPMGPDESRSLTLVGARNKVTEYEDDLNKMLAVFTPTSPPVERQREILGRALEGLKQEQRAYVTSYQVALESARRKEESIRAQLQDAETKNGRVPYLYQRVSLLDTEINNLSGLLEDLQDKMGAVRLSQMADERVSSVEALTKPELYEVISGGKTIIYLVIIIIFAAALGIVAVFVQEAADHRIYSPRDVESSLNLPVFASVSKVD